MKARRFADFDHFVAFSAEDFFTGESGFSPNKRGPEGDGYGPSALPGAPVPPSSGSGSAIGVGGAAAGIPPPPVPPQVPQLPIAPPLRWVPHPPISSTILVPFFTDHSLLSHCQSTSKCHRRRCGASGSVAGQRGQHSAPVGTVGADQQGRRGVQPGAHPLRAGHAHRGCRHRHHGGECNLSFFLLLAHYSRILGGLGQSEIGQPGQTALPRRPGLWIGQLATIATVGEHRRRIGSAQGTGGEGRQMSQRAKSTDNPTERGPTGGQFLHFCSSPKLPKTTNPRRPSPASPCRPSWTICCSQAGLAAALAAVLAGADDRSALTVPAAHGPCPVPGSPTVPFTPSSSPNSTD